MQKRLRNCDNIVITAKYHKSEVFLPKSSVSLPSGRSPLKKAGDCKHRCQFFLDTYIYVYVIFGNKCIYLSSLETNISICHPCKYLSSLKIKLMHFTIVSSTHLWEKNVGSKIVGKISYHVDPEIMIIIIMMMLILLKRKEKIISV